MICVRFAPSPTGYLHIGAARTSFFNWLFARHYQGKFILRIEDTDVARSLEEMSQGIIEGLRWLGLDWDEGPLFQSERIEDYRKKAEELVQKGHAYYCYCLPEEMKKRKEETQSRGSYWSYDRHCLNLTDKEKKLLENEGRLKAIRFLVPDERIEYVDLIHGPINVDSKVVEDFVLLRRDRFPTYHLSVVVDDIDQGITHVIRGDDHISNTPKQILLYKAFGASMPEFAHLALILGPDKKKLSKRHGVTSVLQFRDEGYLRLAFLNFLAQMSWSIGSEERLYSVEEMIEGFSLDKLSKGSPVFDLNKLDWLNGQLISEMRAEDLFSAVKMELKKANLWQDELETDRKNWLLSLIDLLKERSRRITDFAIRAKPFLSDNYDYDPAGIEKYLRDERLGELLPRLKEDFARMEEFTAYSIEWNLRKRAEKEGVKPALFIHALRMLVVGQPVSPGIFDVLELVGKERTVQRMERFVEIV